MQVIFANYSFFLFYLPPFLLIFKLRPKKTLKIKEICILAASIRHLSLQLSKANDSEIVF